LHISILHLARAKRLRRLLNTLRNARRSFVMRLLQFAIAFMTRAKNNYSILPTSLFAVR
jgi:hypothetical protein